ncbi:hypothetical protein niasHT_005497 [Heterodera trifolii]|uniref:F-box domain-containing protein n=1 Tax=Heterodera trifolii TaxID=157864 RepID=A0ABD2LT10_9BILA
MSDRRKEAEEKMAKAIFISADCWLCVFDLITPSQLGLGIAMISRRFNFYVDEHFKTRKWALKFIQIRPKFEENGTKKMEIVNFRGKAVPIPQIQLPRKVNGFELIRIYFIDQNVIAFLRRFCPLFAVCPINLSFHTNNDRTLELILYNIWPMLEKNIHAIKLAGTFFYNLRKFVPSILGDCPSLRFVFFNSLDIFPKFPCDDSATAWDGQAVAKWLFTPLQNDVPKVFKWSLYMDDENWPSNIEPFKAAFASASSPVNFIVVICFTSSFGDSVVPFVLTNGCTHEHLVLKRINDSCHFLLIRCPIARDESKWTKWEEEAIDWKFYDQWNQISILPFRETRGCPSRRIPCPK